MKHLTPPTLMILFVIVGCSPMQKEIASTKENTTIIIWDTDSALASHTTLIPPLKEKFPKTILLSGIKSEEVLASRLEDIFDGQTEEDICIFLFATGNPSAHERWEWNLWFPQLWRDLDCGGKILVADAPWGEEFINPVKAKKPDTVWVTNGPLGHLQRKLPKSLLAASCRFDEVNMVSQGLDDITKTPLFAYYFIQELAIGDTQTAPEGNLLYALDRAKTLTRSARARGVVSDMEEMFFFQRSEIEKEEFFQFPNPSVWNGLARRISIGENS